MSHLHGMVPDNNDDHNLIICHMVVHMSILSFHIFVFVEVDWHSDMSLWLSEDMVDRDLQRLIWWKYILFSNIFFEITY